MLYSSVIKPLEQKDLAQSVLPLIRARGELYRKAIANAHGREMHDAVDLLEEALQTGDPKEVFIVTQKAITSAMYVIAKADDSHGIIGDACRRLLTLHPKVAAYAQVPAAPLVSWMIKFQFDGIVDYFTLDPVDYAPALGELGMARYRKELVARETKLGPRPNDDERWSSDHSHAWFVLGWNEKRLAVLDRDIDAIIRTHVGDRRVAAWFEDTAKAFAEIDEFDLAMDWAQQATDFGSGHQSLHASQYLCELLVVHRPAELLRARLSNFHRWPSSGTAAALHTAAGPDWTKYEQETMKLLTQRPNDSVQFALYTLKDPARAWEIAHTLELASDHTWEILAEAYEQIDPLAVLPVYTHLIENELAIADSKRYKAAARYLNRMRTLTAGTEELNAVDSFIASLRHENRHRPRLQREFDRAGLP